MSGPAPADALVTRVLEGTAPLPLRLAAARGVLPLPRTVLARLFVRLRQDPDESVRREAESSLSSLQSEAIREILVDPACDAEVLRHFAGRAAREEALAEIIAFHPSVGDDAMTVLASEGNSAVIDLVLTNQARLLASPGLLDRLTANPALRTDQRGRILDLLAHFFQEREPEDEEPPPGAPVPLDEAAAREAARILEVDVGELFAASEILDGEEFAKAEDPAVRSAYRKIITLNTARKAVLAMKGGREERTILIRDTNKVVALSVLKNPRLTEQEVETIAAMRNVSDVVLRAVGANRDWSKSYAIVTALVHNPKTPQGISMNFIPRLTDRDLKRLVSDKNVPEMIRRSSKRVYDQRHDKQSQSKIKK